MSVVTLQTICSPQIYIRIKDDEWNIYRRFAQFYELHKQLKKKDPIIKSFDFPQKKTFGYKVICNISCYFLKLLLNPYQYTII